AAFFVASQAKNSLAASFLSSATRLAASFFLASSAASLAASPEFDSTAALPATSLTSIDDLVAGALDNIASLATTRPRATAASRRPNVRFQLALARPFRGS